MGTAPNAENIIMGAGEIFVDRFVVNTTNRTGEISLGECSKLTIDTADDKKQMHSSRKGTRPLLKSVNTKRTVTLKITGHEFSKENLAIALMGTTSALAQGAASIVAEAVSTSVVQGRWYPTLYRNISAVVVKVGASTKTLTTDYLVDAESGRIKVVEGGGIVNGDQIDVDYDYGADTSPIIQGGASESIEGYVRYKSDNTSGIEHELEVWRVNFAPDGEIGLISEEFGEFSIQCEILDDSDAHPAAPYYQLIER